MANTNFNIFADVEMSEDEGEEMQSPSALTNTASNTPVALAEIANPPATSSSPSGAKQQNKRGRPRRDGRYTKREISYMKTDYTACLKNPEWQYDSADSKLRLGKNYTLDSWLNFLEEKVLEGADVPPRWWAEVESRLVVRAQNTDVQGNSPAQQNFAPQSFSMAMPQGMQTSYGEMSEFQGAVVPCSGNIQDAETVPNGQENIPPNDFQNAETEKVRWPSDSTGSLPAGFFLSGGQDNAMSFPDMDWWVGSLAAEQVGSGNFLGDAGMAPNLEIPQAIPLPDTEMANGLEAEDNVDPALQSIPEENKGGEDDDWETWFDMNGSA